MFEGYVIDLDRTEIKFCIGYAGNDIIAFLRFMNDVAQDYAPCSHFIVKDGDLSVFDQTIQDLLKAKVPA